MARVVSLGFAVLLGTSAGVRASDEFIISFWCGSAKAETTLKRYQEIAECGFTVVLPPADVVNQAERADAQTNKKILDRCNQTGLKAILFDHRLFLAKQPSAPDRARNLDGVLTDFAEHPALAGYFLADEPFAGDFPHLGAVSQYLRKKDPKRIPFVNFLPNYASPQQLGTTTYEEHVRQFLRTVKPALVSWDHYALFDNRFGISERQEYFENLGIVRRQATQVGLPFVQIILSVPHLFYRDPTTPSCAGRFSPPSLTARSRIARLRARRAGTRSPVTRLARGGAVSSK